MESCILVDFYFPGVFKGYKMETLAGNGLTRFMPLISFCTL